MSAGSHHVILSPDMGIVVETKDVNHELRVFGEENTSDCQRLGKFSADARDGRMNSHGFLDALRQERKFAQIIPDKKKQLHLNMMWNEKTVIQTTSGQLTIRTWFHHQGDLVPPLWPCPECLDVEPNSRASTIFQKLSCHGLKKNTVKIVLHIRKFTEVRCEFFPEQFWGLV